jgi:hypothetical protein
MYFTYLQILMPEKNIDQVIADLENIIAYCIANNSRAGYFTVLYHRVTCRIKEGVQNKEFEDNLRMEKLDVIFAQRYIDAWNTWKTGGTPTGSWKVAFEAAAKNNTVVLQHLLLGINAHINLDLGIAAAQTMTGYPIAGIQKDFNAINTVLASLVDEVQDNLGKVSPMMWLADMLSHSHDEKLATFSINIAREGAWLFAQEVSGKTGQAFTDCVNARDTSIAQLGAAIASPRGKIFAFLIGLVSWCEWKKPASIIEKLKYVVKQAAEQTINDVPVQ